MRSLLVTVMTRTAGVPFVDLSRQHAGIAVELQAAFERTLAASAFILGREVEAFEAQFAECCEAEHCVGVGLGHRSPRDRAASGRHRPGRRGRRPGAHLHRDSPRRCSTPAPRPVFCDVVRGQWAHRSPLGRGGDLDAHRRDRAGAPLRTGVRHGRARRAWRGDTACCCSRTPPRRTARHGAARRVGSLGDAAAFSFYPSKNLGALGDGGAICTSDATIAERARRLRNLGQRAKGRHTELGLQRAARRAAGGAAAGEAAAPRRLERGTRETRRALSRAPSAGHPHGDGGSEEPERPPSPGRALLRARRTALRRSRRRGSGAGCTTRRRSIASHRARAPCARGPASGTRRPGRARSCRCRCSPRCATTRWTGSPRPASHGPPVTRRSCPGAPPCARDDAPDAPPRMRSAARDCLPRLCPSGRRASRRFPRRRPRRRRS